MSSIISTGLNYLKKFQKAKSIEDDIQIGEGTVANINNVKVAVYKKSENETIKLSPSCTHKGCEVAWNSPEKTWDCPCHGARFNSDGSVKQGPATEPLKTVS